VNCIRNEDIWRGKEVCIHRSDTYRPGKDLVESAAADKWVLCLSGPIRLQFNEGWSQ
ncbi:putative alpha-2-macroglobulin-like protein 1, partial [Triplophysa rosa]